MRFKHTALMIAQLACIHPATGLVMMPLTMSRETFLPRASTGTSHARGVLQEGAALFFRKNRRGRRAMLPTMTGSHDDDAGDASLGQEPVIPDAVGASAIQAQLDSIRRRNRAARSAAKRSASAGRRSRLQGFKRQPETPYAVWVLVFNGGSQVGAQRGLYCLWAKGFNSVVAFEGREGALRYSLELKAQGLGMPGPTRVSMKDLNRFCDDHSFGLQLVPVDVVPVAPDRNKAELGYEALPQGGDSSGEGSILTPEDLRRFRESFERLYLWE